MDEVKPQGSSTISAEPILLNDILRLGDLERVRLRFNQEFNTGRKPIDYFTDNSEKSMRKLLDSHYYKGVNNKYHVGYITLAFVEIPSQPDCWLLVHVGEVTKELDVCKGVGYEFRNLDEYNKYIGRVIIHFKNNAQNLVRRGITTLHLCEVMEILSAKYEIGPFPGYDKVDVSWWELSSAIKTESWRTALGNQKGVYLLTDVKNGKHYVGSAYGDEMLLGRWKSYIETCHGGNKLLKKLGDNYIRENFRFSILETFKSNTIDDDILERESYWKEILRTRDGFGYNDN